MQNANFSDVVMFVLYTWRKILFEVFIDQGELVKYQESNLPIKPIVIRAIKGALLIVIAFELLSPYLD